MNFNGNGDKAEGKNTAADRPSHAYRLSGANGCCYGIYVLIFFGFAPMQRFESAITECYGLTRAARCWRASY
jgi:hypothetical protein